MKANKEDIRVLKSKHRLELVMQEAGEVFEVDAEHSDQWHSKTTPGLTVDIRRRLYEIKKPGMDSETGDVLAWLQRRYGWSFGMAVKFLQSCPPDPKSETQPAQVAKAKKKVMPLSSEYVIKTVLNKDPITGRQDYGIEYRYDLMDDLQRRALDAAGDWVIKYFTKSSREIFEKMNEYPHGFKQVVNFEIRKCAHCEKPFSWQAVAEIAYAQEVVKWIGVAVSIEEGEVMGNLTADDGEEIDKLPIDADFVICEECLRKIYAPHYMALDLCRRSARRREEVAEKERRRIERESEEQEERERERKEQRMIDEAEFP